MVYASIVGTGVSSTIAGGLNNAADGYYSSVGGGRNNLAKKTDSTVGGGKANKAKGPQLTVSGGKANVTSGKYSTVIGGWKNTASGNSATVAGGEDNIASGGVSFAAGQRAHAAHGGTFVWADATGADFSSTADNQFIIRANGGVGINMSSEDMDELNISESDGSADTEIAFFYTGSGGGTPGRFHIGVQDDGTLTVKSFTPDATRLLTIEPGGNVGIGTDTPQSALQVSGYLQVDLTSGTPPAGDCDAAAEAGRTKFDDTSDTVYICSGASGWISK